MPPHATPVSPVPPLGPQAPVKVPRTLPRVRILVFVILCLALGGGWYAVHAGYAKGFLAKLPHKTPAQKSLAAIIKEDYMQSVVAVYCLDPEGHEIASGSGVYFVSDDGKPMIETNSHVAFAYDYKNYYGCNVYFPRLPDGGFYSSAYYAGEAVGYFNKESVINGEKVEGLDYAILTLTRPYETPQGVPYPFPPAERDVYDTQKEVCPNGQDIQLADRVITLGYPGVGEQSLTITDGLIAGFSGARIKISAPINHGNSGGIAISPETGCMLGIPTSGRGNSDGGSIGYLIPEWYKQVFLEGLTGEGTYGAREAKEKFVPYTTSGGTTFDRPEFWAQETLAASSVIVGKNSYLDALPGLTIEKLENGSVRVVNPGGVKFSQPPADIFDVSNANFRFLESDYAGGSAVAALHSVVSGIDYLFGGEQRILSEPTQGFTDDGYPLISFSYIYQDPVSGAAVLYFHRLVFEHNRLYQFIGSVYGADLATANPAKDYVGIAKKLDKVAASLKIR
jgi:hypothetical protein